MVLRFVLAVRQVEHREIQGTCTDTYHFSVSLQLTDQAPFKKGTQELVLLPRSAVLRS